MRKLLEKITITTAIAFALPVFADFSPIDEEELRTTNEMRKDMINSVRVIDRYHYQPQQLDDDLSAKILNRYLDLLDSSRIYFTESDIDTFRKYRKRLDDSLLSADAEPAFTIYKVFRQRVAERNDYVKTLLQKEFDFTLTESIVVDRSELDWPDGLDALNEVWRKKIKNDFLTQKLGGTSLDEIRENLEKRYDRQMHVVWQTKPEEVFEYFMNAYTKEIEPHTQYMSSVTAENFAIHMSLSLEGIGASLQTENDYTVVKKIIVGGPAEKSGQLSPEDKIIGVGQSADSIENVIGWRLMDVVKQIRGKKGSKVFLQVQHEGAVPGSPPDLIVLTRDVIRLDEQAAKLYYEQNGPKRYGVIEIPSFYLDSKSRRENPEDYKSTTNDVKRLINEATKTGIDGLVIDLRGNGGGFLDEAVKLTGLFIDKGPVVQIKHTTNKSQGLSDRDEGTYYDGPLLVMVDRFSASASEIFSGAMQDYGRAVIVGERTFGKGTVQRLTPLSVNSRDSISSELKITTAQFFRVNGESTQHKGVTPDIIIDTGDEYDDFGERAYDNALPWAVITPMRYTKTLLSGNAVTDAASKHRLRTEANPSFIYLRNANRLNEEVADLKEISLSEKERKQSFEQREEVRLALVNQYRKTLDLKALDRDELKDASDDLPDGDDHWKRVFQREAANILHDLINNNVVEMTAQSDLNKAALPSVKN